MRAALPLLALILTGCDSPNPTFGDLMHAREKSALETHPPGRYHFIQIRRVDDQDEEVVFLDTAQGRVCIQTLTANPKLVAANLGPTCWDAAPESE